MDFTDIEGITRDDLNAENKDLRRSIYVEFTSEFTKSASKKMDLLLCFTKKFGTYLRENALTCNFESDILYNFFKENKAPSRLESPQVHVEPENLHLAQRSSFQPGRNLRIADIFKRKRPRKKKKKLQLLDEIFSRQSDNFMLYSPITSDYSDSDSEGTKKRDAEIVELIYGFRKIRAITQAKFESISKQPVDKEDHEVGCSSPPSSVLLPPPSSLTIADQLERKRTSESDLEGGDTARVVHQDSSDISDNFFEVRKISSTSEPVDTEDVCSSEVRKKTKRYQHKSFRTRKVPNALEASSTNTSGSDMSDYGREAWARVRWGRGRRKPCYAHVKVLIFVDRSVCQKLAKYLGLIYIEDILTEARKNMFKLNGISKKNDLKYCPFIQPYITKKRIISGCHDICLTHTKYLWQTIYADFKAVISKSDDAKDKKFYLEPKEDADIYVELGERPHFLEYLEAVADIINEKLEDCYYSIARYKFKNRRGEDLYFPIKLSLIAIVPFDILDSLIFCD